MSLGLPHSRVPRSGITSIRLVMPDFLCPERGQLVPRCI